jgi:multidrug efflux pump subunit AcrA (membrane-fusion protein)
VSAAEATASAAGALASSDQSRYQSACPTGPVPPASNLTGSALQAAEAAFTECQTLQSQRDRDAAAFDQAKAQVPFVQAQSQQAINQAQSTVNSAEAALQSAQYQLTYQGSANNPTALSQAQAALGAAQEQLVQIEKSLSDATLVASGSGVVAEVYGAVGEYLGSGGVQQYQNPAALQQNPSSGGFNLFPTQTTPSGSSTSAGGAEPLVEIVGGQQQVMAQVPETKIGKLPVGHAATVSVPALGLTTSGVVTEVVLNPTRGTSVSYDVIVTLDRTVSGLLPGMSATVRS